MTFDFRPNQNEDRNEPVENMQESDISAKIGEAEISGVEDGHVFVPERTDPLPGDGK